MAIHAQDFRLPLNDSLPICDYNIKILDRDIATIEALHDMLLDNKILGLNHNLLKRSRSLTERMYKAIDLEL